MRLCGLDVRRDALCGAFYLAALFVFLNCIVHLVGLFLFINRPLFNIDYLALSPLVLWRRWGWFSGLLVIFLILDLIFSLAPAWHFRPATILMSLADAGHLSPPVVFLLAGVIVFLFIVVALGVVFLLQRLMPDVRSKIISLICMAVVGLGVMGLDSSLSGRFFHALDQVNVVTSGLNSFRVAMRTWGNGGSAMAPVSDMATGDLFDQLKNADNALPSHIVLIVVESFGLFHDEGVNFDQIEPLLGVADRFSGVDVGYGEVVFSGSTVSAELRELCGFYMESTHPEVSGYKTQCLPFRLMEKGFSSHAVHGFTGSMFSRKRWYHELGFENIFFAPDLVLEGVKDRCGNVFSGICDYAVWDWIVDGLGGEGRKFIYWLTLTAHLPLPSEPEWVGGGVNDCPVPAPQCALFLTHKKLFSKIADSILNGDLEDTLLIIVGDHSPPYLGPQQRAAFSQTHVPWVELRIPRGGRD